MKEEVYRKFISKVERHVNPSLQKINRDLKACVVRVTDFPKGPAEFVHHEVEILNGQQRIGKVDFSPCVFEIEEDNSAMHAHAVLQRSLEIVGALIDLKIRTIEKGMEQITQTLFQPMVELGVEQALADLIEQAGMYVALRKEQEDPDPDLEEAVEFGKTALAGLQKLLNKKA